MKKSFIIIFLLLATFYLIFFICRDYWNNWIVPVSTFAIHNDGNKTLYSVELLLWDAGAKTIKRKFPKISPSETVFVEVDTSDLYFGSLNLEIDKKKYKWTCEDEDLGLLATFNEIIILSIKENAKIDTVRYFSKNTMPDKFRKQENKK